MNRGEQSLSPLEEENEHLRALLREARDAYARQGAALAKEKARGDTLARALELMTRAEGLRERAGCAT